jgi:hypothetical protein
MQPILHSLTHTMPADAVFAEELTLGTDLIEVGRDLDDIDLADLAVQFMLRDLRDKAFDLGIPIRERDWSRTCHGDVEVVFRFEQAAEMVMFRTLVL